jgi:hypothetical protein
MTDVPNALESALDAIEGDADATLRILASAVRSAKRAKAAAASGQLRDLQQALEATAALADQAATAAQDLRAGWRFDAGTYFASGAYAKELLACAADAGLQAFESDDLILSYPAIVQVSAGDATVVVDKTKERRVRPSVLVGQLAALQQRPPKFKPEPFIEALAAAYDLVAGARRLRPGAPARLVDVHRVLTLLPGSARDYSRQELARDLYLLDQSGVVDVKDGRRMSLPASAMTRSGPVLTTVTRSGQTKVYAGITFADPVT